MHDIINAHLCWNLNTAIITHISLNCKFTSQWIIANFKFRAVREISAPRKNESACARENAVRAEFIVRIVPLFTNMIWILNEIFRESHGGFGGVEIAQRVEAPQKIWHFFFQFIAFF